MPSLVRLLDAQQCAVADPGRGARLRPARNDDADFWRGAAFLDVPFGGSGDQLAVGVPAGDVGKHGMRQLRRLMHLAAAFGDRAVIGKLAQNSFQLDAVGILQPELACDLAGADLAGMGADEGEDGVTARKALLAPPVHPRALPALFLAGAFSAAAGFDADVLAAAGTGARALLAASDLGSAAAFLATAFLAGLAASSLSGLASDFVLAFAGAAFLAPRLGLPPPLAARSSISAMACASVIVSGGAMSLGMVALTPPAVT